MTIRSIWILTILFSCCTIFLSCTAPGGERVIYKRGGVLVSTTVGIIHFAEVYQRRHDLQWGQPSQITRTTTGYKLYYDMAPGEHQHPCPVR